MRNITEEELANEIAAISEEMLKTGIQEGMTIAARIADGYAAKCLNSPVRFTIASGIKHDILHARDNPTP